MKEQTVVLIKPDGFSKKIVGQIIDRFERAGLLIVGLKQLRLSKDLLEVWYVHHKDKPFFPDIVSQMTSTPVIAIILEGDSAIQRVFDISGPTDPKEAPAGTLRGDFGESKPLNVVHRSDSAQAAQKEIKLLFTPEEIFGGN